MKVFKFGGAALREAERLEKVASIISSNKKENETMVIVVSAMGKMTNAFEAYISDRTLGGDGVQALKMIRDYHIDLLKSLGIKDLEEVVLNELNELQNIVFSTRDQFYDQVVRTGEHLSSKIVAGFLELKGITNTLLNADKLIVTDSRSRDAKIDFEATAPLLKKEINRGGVFIIQGFIGADQNGKYTTLGREGSDYTAAAVAYCVNAESLSIWKDVSGVLSSDPRYFEDGVLLPYLSYKDAIELSYYGASIIHPKTIQPLQNKNIKLFVRSFLNPNSPGTTIANDDVDLSNEQKILHKNLLLVTLKTKDFSFIEEGHMKALFTILDDHNTKLRAIEQSAVQLSVIIRNEAGAYEDLLKALGEEFILKYNDKMTLLTIRNYLNQHAEDYVKQEIMLLQKSREVMRIAYQS